MSYIPVNPSFGGNALNSSQLLATASAQRSATATDVPIASSAGASSGSTNTQADLFVSQLQSRLLSALASQVTQAIFGDNPQDNGTITFGDTNITFVVTAETIRLVITDFTTGTITEIEVPQLVSN